MADDVTGDLYVAPEIVIPAAELRWQFSHSSGPGGQSVNTSDTRVELSWDATRSNVLSPEALQRLRPRLIRGVLTVVASEHRSQLRNREEARRKLAAVVRGACQKPPPPRRATRPTRGSQERRLAEKKRRSAVKRERRRDARDY